MATLTFMRCPTLWVPTWIKHRTHLLSIHLPPLRFQTYYAMVDKLLGSESRQLSEQSTGRMSALLYPRVDVPAIYRQPIPSSSAYAGLRQEEREIARQRRPLQEEVQQLLRSHIQHERSPGDPYFRSGSRQSFKLGRDYISLPTVNPPPLSSPDDIPAYLAQTVGSSAMPMTQEYVGTIAGYV